MGKTANVVSYFRNILLLVNIASLLCMLEYNRIVDVITSAVFIFLFSCNDDVDYYDLCFPLTYCLIVLRLT